MTKEYIKQLRDAGAEIWAYDCYGNALVAVFKTVRELMENAPWISILEPEDWDQMDCTCLGIIKNRKDAHIATDEEIGAV